MQNFFSSSSYDTKDDQNTFQTIIFMKNQDGTYQKCYFLMEYQIITLTDFNLGAQILEQFNIKNTYIEFKVNLHMGKGVIIQLKNKQIELFGLTTYMIQQFKLYCIQNDFASQYKVLSQVGQGSFGKVYKIQKISDNSIWAVKVFEKQLLLDQRDKNAILKEIQILRLMNHPNTQKMIECFESDQCIFLVQEYIPKKLKINKNRIYKEDEAIQFLIQLVKGLDYIHSKGIFHRDIKPDNILIKENNEPVIVDFGFADYYSVDGKYLFKRCGTKGYIAPEIYLSNLYDYKVDIYSLGIVFQYLLTGQTVDNSKKESLSQECQNLISQMLEPCPHKRISLKQIKEQSVIRKSEKRQSIFKAMGSLNDSNQKTNISTDTNQFSINSLQLASEQSI